MTMNGLDVALCVLAVWVFCGPLLVYIVPKGSVCTSDRYAVYLFLLGPLSWYVLLVVFAKDKYYRKDFFQRMQSFDGEQQ